MQRTFKLGRKQSIVRSVQLLGHAVFGCSLRRARESASVEREEFALLLGRRDDSTGCWPARIVPILHAFLEETIAPLALQSLLIRTELAGRHFLLCVNCKTRPPQQEHNQSGSRKRATRHAKPLCMSSRLLVRRGLGETSPSLRWLNA
jgi:hypothetical protein